MGTDHGSTNARRGLFLAPFDELSEPSLLADLAVRAESRGWDGLFLWDHIVFPPPVRAVADPWIVLSAIAAKTARLRIGPMVTPLSRRRVQKVARETVTLDRLSRGRLTWAASGMCRQVRLIWPPSFGHGRRCLRVCVLVCVCRGVRGRCCRSVGRYRASV